MADSDENEKVMLGELLEAEVLEAEVLMHKEDGSGSDNYDEDVGEDDDDVENEDVDDDDEDEDDEDESDYGNNRYYTSYNNYISPNGIRYNKHNAVVPNEYLIEYIKCMNYQKFEYKYIVIELDKYCKNAKITRYIKGWKKISKHYIDDTEVFYSEIYTLLLSATSKKYVKCYRPSYLYTAKLIQSSDYMDEESMEEIKYTGAGFVKVSYDGHAFIPLMHDGVYGLIYAKI